MELDTPNHSPLLPETIRSSAQWFRIQASHSATFPPASMANELDHAKKNSFKKNRHKKTHPDLWLRMPQMASERART